MDGLGYSKQVSRNKQGRLPLSTDVANVPWTTSSPFYVYSPQTHPHEQASEEMDHRM